MAFKKFLKRKQNLTKKDSSEKTLGDQEILANLNFRQKLFFNQGEALLNITLWLSFFASSWLVSGLISQNYEILTLVFFPLIFIFLYTEKQLKEKNNITLNKNILFLTLSTIYSSYLFYRDQRYIIVILFFIASQLRLILPIINFRKNNQSIFSFIVSCLSSFVFFACLLLLGLFSQTKDDFILDDLKYLVLVLIPGTVFIAREILRYSNFLKMKGWTFESIKNKDEKILKRPGSISRLIIGLMIIGPAIPALLLPFNVIPQSLFAVSLCFLKVPKLAEEIQAEAGSFDERVINLTKFVFLTTFLNFLGAFLHVYNVL
jgi:hypothetical protein